MTRRELTSRLTAIRDYCDPPIDPQLRAFAQAVIRFGGHEPTPESIDRLARWYAGGYRTQQLPR